MEALLIVAIIAVVSYVRRRRHGPVVVSEIGPVGWVEGTEWAVARPLARADARRFVRHPAFIIGLAITPLMLWAALGTETSWRSISTGIALACVPLGWATIIGAHLLGTQARRSGADEVLAASPAPQPVRTSGLLLAGAVPAVASALLVAGWVLLLPGVRDGLNGAARPLEVGAGVLIVAGSVAVGVAVARFWSFAGAGVLAAVVTVVLQARFLDVTTWPWDRQQSDPLRFLAFLAEPTSVGHEALEVRPAGWHLLYLAGLVGMMAVVALARDGLRPRVIGALGACLAVVAVAGVMQVQPPSDRQVGAMVDFLTNPIAHQRCVEDGNAQYCAYPRNEHRLDDWQQRAEAVLALVPDEVARRRLDVVDRVPTMTGSPDCSPQPFLEGLPAEVVDAVTPATVWPRDGDVHPGTSRFPCGGRQTAEFFTAVQVGAWAVGLPPSPHGRDERCAAHGQARAVLALWLGAAASPDGRLRLEQVLDERAHEGTPTLTFADWDEPPMWGVEFATVDAELAHAAAGLPVDRVRAVVTGEWDTLTDRDTPSTTFARLLGLDPRSSQSGTTTMACR